MIRSAALDPSTSRDECAFIAIELRGRVWHLAAGKTWQGRTGAPLDIRNKVAPEAARLARNLGCDSWMSDLYMSADVELVSRDFGLSFRRDEAELVESFGHMRQLARERRVWLRSDNPDLDAVGLQIAGELRGVTLLRRNGKTQVVLPRSRGKHGDAARAWIRALWHGRMLEDGAAHNYSAGYGLRGGLGTTLCARLVR